MALFGMLLKEKYDFEVAFVNYKTRENSNYEQKLVEEFANEHGIKCHILEKKCSSAANFKLLYKKYWGSAAFLLIFIFSYLLNFINLI